MHLTEGMWGIHPIVSINWQLIKGLIVSNIISFVKCYVFEKDWKWGICFENTNFMKNVAIQKGSYNDV